MSTLRTPFCAVQRLFHQAASELTDSTKGKPSHTNHAERSGRTTARTGTKSRLNSIFFMERDPSAATRKCHGTRVVGTTDIPRRHAPSRKLTITLLRDFQHYAKPCGNDRPLARVCLIRFRLTAQESGPVRRKQ
jgi:hypothetical protein